MDRVGDRMDGRGKILLAAALIASLAAASVLLSTEEADAGGTKLKEFYCYGYVLDLEDRNYNVLTYSEIGWTLAYTYEGLDTPVWKSDDPRPSYRIDPGEHPLFSKFPVFVRERAVVDGVERITDMVIHVNPIQTSCYAVFMYDSDRGYQYVQFTGYTTILKGSGYFAAPPSKDPARDGYAFEGWYTDKGCTVPYTADTVIQFSADSKEFPIYPKWRPVSTPDPPAPKIRSVVVHPVSGLDIRYDGTVVDGGRFSMTVGVTDGFRFDLSDMTATASNGDVLKKTVVGDGRYEFSLPSVTQNLDVFLSGYRQYFRVTALLDSVHVSDGGKVPEWVPSGSTLELPLTSDTGGTKARVYVAYVDMTAASFVDDTIRIANVDGDVLIMAYAVPDSGRDTKEVIPFWVWIAIAVLVVLLAAAYYRRERKE